MKSQGVGLYSYNLFTVSERDYQRLRQLHLEYFRELRSIVAKSERVVLAHLSLLPLTGAPPEPSPAASRRPPRPTRERV